MNFFRNPAVLRADTWGDHAISLVATLATIAALGATIVLTANFAERLIDPQTPTGVRAMSALWVLGITMMTAPKLIWPLMAPGITALLAARRFGLGGAIVAAGIGVTLAIAFGNGWQASTADGLIQIAIGAITGLVYWAILRWRCSRPEFQPRSFTDR